MILLDNLLLCLLLITVIDLSKTCDSTATSIYNALVVFIIHPQIKIKLKMLILLAGVPLFPLCISWHTAFHRCLQGRNGWHVMRTLKQQLDEHRSAAAVVLETVDFFDLVFRLAGQARLCGTKNAGGK
jgi:hypothetical protein